MATAAGAKKAVIFGGTVATGLTALQHTATEGGMVPVRIVVGGILATAIMLALADWQPDLGAGLAVLVMLTSLLTQGRIDLFKRIGGKI